MVVWEDGTPAPEVDIYLEDSENVGFCVNGCDKKTDSYGNFILNGYENRKYRVKAKIEKQIDGQTVVFSAESETFSPNGNLTKIKLILKKEKTEGSNNC